MPFFLKPCFKLRKRHKKNKKRREQAMSTFYDNVMPVTEKQIAEECYLNGIISSSIEDESTTSAQSKLSDDAIESLPQDSPKTPPTIENESLPNEEELTKQENTALGVSGIGDTAEDEKCLNTSDSLQDLEEVNSERNIGNVNKKTIDNDDLEEKYENTSKQSLDNSFGEKPLKQNEVNEYSTNEFETKMTSLLPSPVSQRMEEDENSLKLESFHVNTVEEVKIPIFDSTEIPQMTIQTTDEKSQVICTKNQDGCFIIPEIKIDLVDGYEKFKEETGNSEKELTINDQMDGDNSEEKLVEDSCMGDAILMEKLVKNIQIDDSTSMDELTKDSLVDNISSKKELFKAIQMNGDISKDENDNNRQLSNDVSEEELPKDNVINDDRLKEELIKDTALHDDVSTVELTEENEITGDDLNKELTKHKQMDDLKRRLTRCNRLDLLEQLQLMKEEGKFDSGDSGERVSNRPRILIIYKTFSKYDDSTPAKHDSINDQTEHAAENTIPDTKENSCLEDNRNDSLHLTGQHHDDTEEDLELRNTLECSGDYFKKPKSSPNINGNEDDELHNRREIEQMGNSVGDFEHSVQGIFNPEENRTKLYAGSKTNKFQTCRNTRNVLLNTFLSETCSSKCRYELKNFIDSLQEEDTFSNSESHSEVSTLEEENGEKEKINSQINENNEQSDCEFLIEESNTSNVKPLKTKELFMAHQSSQLGLKQDTENIDHEIDLQKLMVDEKCKSAENQAKTSMDSKKCENAKHIIPIHRTRSLNLGRRTVIYVPSTASCESSLQKQLERSHNTFDYLSGNKMEDNKINGYETLCDPYSKESYKVTEKDKRDYSPNFQETDEQNLEKADVSETNLLFNKINKYDSSNDNIRMSLEKDNSENLQSKCNYGRDRGRTESESKIIDIRPNSNLRKSHSDEKDLRKVCVAEMLQKRTHLLNNISPFKEENITAKEFQGMTVSSSERQINDKYQHRNINQNNETNFLREKMSKQMIMSIQEQLDSLQAVLDDNKKYSCSYSNKKYRHSGNIFHNQNAGYVGSEASVKNFLSSSENLAKTSKRQSLNGDNNELLYELLQTVTRDKDSGENNDKCDEIGSSERFKSVKPSKNISINTAKIVHGQSFTSNSSASSKLSEGGDIGGFANKSSYDTLNNKIAACGDQSSAEMEISANLDRDSVFPHKSFQPIRNIKNKVPQSPQRTNVSVVIDMQHKRDLQPKLTINISPRKTATASKCSGKMEILGDEHIDQTNFLPTPRRGLNIKCGDTMYGDPRQGLNEASRKVLERFERRRAHLFDIKRIEKARRLENENFNRYKYEATADMHPWTREIPIHTAQSFEFAFSNLEKTKNTAKNSNRFPRFCPEETDSFSDDAEISVPFSQPDDHTFKLIKRELKPSITSPGDPDAKLSTSSRKVRNRRILSDHGKMIISPSSSLRGTRFRERLLNASRDIRSPKYPLKMSRKNFQTRNFATRGRTIFSKSSPNQLIPRSSLAISIRNKELCKPQLRNVRETSKKSTEIVKGNAVIQELYHETLDGSRSAEPNNFAVTKGTSSEELKSKFDENFKRYASKGRANGELISYKRSTVWLKDAGIVGEILTVEEANDVFKCTAGVKIALNKYDYRRFLYKLTRLKRLNYREIYERLCATSNERIDCLE